MDMNQIPEDDETLDRKALLSQMAGAPKPAAIAPRNDVPDAPLPIQNVTMPAPGAQPVPLNPAPTNMQPLAAPPAAAAPGAFQSQNATVRGYLDEAVRAHAGTVQGIKDEAGRKASVEQYLQTLLPEVQKRGGNMTDIKGEKAMVDGRLIDFYRDIEGAAEPQYLDDTDGGGAAAAPAASAGIRASNTR